MGNSEYRLPQEYVLEAEINELSSQLQDLTSKQERLTDQLGDAGQLRALLYGTGKELERAVQRALVTLGFNAVPFVSDNSEFDVVFESDEGRFIGEVEGRDTSAVNVAKISQLRRNVDEHFQRDEVDRPAIGVLFGNGFRLEEPETRAEAFTTKVISSAETLGIALVRTKDLFTAAKAALETPDEDFCRECRRAIADSVGEIVEFPRLNSSQDELVQGS
jgi:outer membrane murein-binding lipoprotein Lpp